QIPYADTNDSLSVEVHLKHAADVFLVDSINFQHYKAGRSFKYYGGHYTRTPVRISVQDALDGGILLSMEVGNINTVSINTL
ncbi:DUF1883 domain-containing protein, partial [Bacillus safensis]|uniref:DUF1883 domain-containing protein n=2 Tax=Bacillaceae TaxID=186817 RepID=UPI002281D5ED